MKRLIALVLILCMAAVGAFAEAPSWVNSNLLGSVSPDTEALPQEDFNVYINKDWIVNAKIPEGSMSINSFSERSAEVRAQMTALLNGEPAQSEDGRCVQAFYRDNMDMETRNALGMEPIMPYVNAIAEIQSIDDLSAYLLRKEQVYNILYTYAISTDMMDSSRMAAYVGGRTFLLEDADEYRSITEVGQRKKDAYSAAMVKLLERIGYTEEAARGQVELAFEIEGKMAANTMGSSAQKQPDFQSKLYNPVSFEELSTLSPVFPLSQLVQECVDMGVNTFIVIDKDDLATMNELYTEENLEAFKAYFLCRTLFTAAETLDQECIDIRDESRSAIGGMEIHTVISDMAYSQCSTLMSMSMAKMYCDEYVTEADKDNIRKIVENALAYYRVKLENNDWLSAETRDKALEKLDNIVIRVGAPDDWTPYHLDEAAYLPVENGGSLLASTLALGAKSESDTLKHVNDPVIREDWTNNPIEVNAYYGFTDNSINILAGIMGGIFYSSDASEAEQMGTLGVIIGHEITHAFDTLGSQYDKLGNLANWWTDEDRAAFNARTAKIEAYYSSIEVLPGRNVDGLLTISETVADLGGVSCMLSIAKSIEGFDYDEFFTSFARLWRGQMPAAYFETLLSDVHAPYHLRTNVNVQQFQEFYDTYGVKEGDGMYLAPEDRLSVW